MKPVVANRSCVGCFKSLSDHTRLKILSLIKEKGLSVSDITRQVNVTQPTVSHHLMVLEERRLVTSLKQGRTTIYVFNKNYPCKACGVFSAPIVTV